MNNYIDCIKELFQDQYDSVEVEDCKIVGLKGGRKYLLDYDIKIYEDEIVIQTIEL